MFVAVLSLPMNDDMTVNLSAWPDEGTAEHLWEVAGEFFQPVSPTPLHDNFLDGKKVIRSFRADGFLIFEID